VHRTSALDWDGTARPCALQLKNRARRRSSNSDAADSACLDGWFSRRPADRIWQLAHICSEAFGGAVVRRPIESFSR
jgi:hypothetical protein